MCGAWKKKPNHRATVDSHSEATVFARCQRLPIRIYHFMTIHLHADCRFDCNFYAAEQVEIELGIAISGKLA